MPKANDGLKQFQVDLTLALTAQAQYRASLEALSEIKSPRPVAFVQQANSSGGPQQVNTGSVPPASATGGRGSVLPEPGGQLLARANSSESLLVPVAAASLSASSSRGDKQPSMVSQRGTSQSSL
jgi:hypothetical protein